MEFDLPTKKKDEIKIKSMIFRVSFSEIKKICNWIRKSKKKNWY